MRRIVSLSVLACVLLLTSVPWLAPIGASDDGPCPDIPFDAALEEDYPTYRYRCITPETFTVAGSELGFTDTFGIDWIRPGMNAGPCSTSFLLTDDDGAYYLTQSAHCVGSTSANDFCAGTYDAVGTSVEIEGYALPATVAYVSGLQMQSDGATSQECASYDFAILRIPSAYDSVVHPAIRHIGGPTYLADSLQMLYGDPMAGYGNSDDRGFVLEFATGTDHGEQPVWPVVNTFEGYYVGAVLNEALCTVDNIFCEPYNPYNGIHGYRQYARYLPSKITGDSGSADLTGDGGALGVTSVINFATGLNAYMPLYDALLKIHVETGKTYRLVTWDEWSPDTIETMPEL